MVQPFLVPFEHKEDRAYHAEGGPKVVHCQLFFHNEDGEAGENCHGDYFLNNFQLRQGVDFVSESVGRDLKAIFKEGDSPADNYGYEERFCS